MSVGTFCIIIRVWESFFSFLHFAFILFMTSTYIGLLKKKKKKKVPNLNFLKKQILLCILPQWLTMKGQRVVLLFSSSALFRLLLPSSPSQITKWGKKKRGGTDLRPWIHYGPDPITSLKCPCCSPIYCKLCTSDQVLVSSCGCLSNESQDLCSPSQPWIPKTNNMLIKLKLYVFLHGWISLRPPGVFVFPLEVSLDHAGVWSSSAFTAELPPLEILDSWLTFNATVK